jgi:hypothetical protein
MPSILGVWGFVYYILLLPEYFQGPHLLVQTPLDVKLESET